ncbi:MAG TPA: amidohydrolase family protein [Solirubrobacteraceae bacterium]|nr:amidohydrolase family protein [Solirubrobacteraceae bacterium]
MTVIDVHTHFLPYEILEYFASDDGPDGVGVEERPGRDPLVVHANGLRYPAFPLFHDAAAKLEQMDRDGIDRAVVSIVPTLLLYDLDPAETARAHRIINDAAVTFAERGGDRLSAMAAVPLTDPDAAVEELRRAHGLGLRGVEIGTSARDVMLDDPALDGFWSAAEELGLPVMIHPYAMMLSEPEPALRGYHLANAVGNPHETFGAAGRLIVGGVLDRHPGLRFLLVHGGGSFPYQLGRLAHAYGAREDTRAVAKRDPREYLEHFLFDTVVFEERALEYLVAFAGDEQVLFGTDLPFDMADLSALQHVPRVASGEAAERILGGNAARVFGI